MNVTVASDTAGRQSLTVGAVVAHNIREIRGKRGMSQQDVADRLNELTGGDLRQASISAMERVDESGRAVRKFDVQLLLLLAVVFNVPVTYFLAPPKDLGDHVLADVDQPVRDLWRFVLGDGDQVAEIDERIRQVEPEIGLRSPFRSWRRQRLQSIDEVTDLSRQLASCLDELQRHLARRRLAECSGAEAAPPAAEGVYDPTV